MSRWETVYLEEAVKDMKRLDATTAARVQRAIDRVAENPLPQSEGGYGKPLGNRGGTDLSGLMKVKLKKDGVRIVYKIQRDEGRMLIVVIGARSDYEVYRTAQRRRSGHGL